MNPNIDDRPPLTNEEFDELKALISKGQGNFSDEILSSAEYLHPLNLKMSHSPVTHVATAPYLFKCGFCSDINFPIQWYQIILDAVGGDASYQPSSKVSDLEMGNNGKNLAKISEDDKTDYQSSSLNFKKSVGYICDHCRDCEND